MGTTLTIEDALLEKARKVSRQRHCSLREVVEDALGASFPMALKKASSSAERPLKTFAGLRLQPGIDLTSSSALLEAMES